MSASMIHGGIKARELHRCCPAFPLFEGRRPGFGRGFTLIELMVAIAIIGILVGTAQSSFRSHMMRARRSEAKIGLESIYRAQTSYLAEFSVYGDTFAEVGYPIEGGYRIDDRTMRVATYTFTVRALPLDGKPRANFQAVATGDLDPGDGVLDILMIENYLTVLP